jgi:hypothetical protein
VLHLNGRFSHIHRRNITKESILYFGIWDPVEPFCTILLSKTLVGAGKMKKMMAGNRSFCFVDSAELTKAIFSFRVLEQSLINPPFWKCARFFPDNVTHACGVYRRSAVVRRCMTGLSLPYFLPPLRVRCRVCCSIPSGSPCAIASRPLSSGGIRFKPRGIFCGCFPQPVVLLVNIIIHFPVAG